MEQRGSAKQQQQQQQPQLRPVVSQGSAGVDSLSKRLQTGSARKQNVDEDDSNSEGVNYQ